MMEVGKKYFISELLKVNKNSKSSTYNVNDIRKSNKVNNRLNRLEKELF